MMASSITAADGPWTFSRSIAADRVHNRRHDTATTSAASSLTFALVADRLLWPRRTRRRRPRTAPVVVPATLSADRPGPVVNRNIYGHFAEHLGRGIYEGIWVGPESADSEHARHPQRRRGGAQGTEHPGAALARRLLCRRVSLEGRHRAAREASVDDQHELGRRGREQRLRHPRVHGPGRAARHATPTSPGNVGSGTAQEMMEWVEYMTSDAVSPMANLRRQNGREQGVAPRRTSASATSRGAAAATCGPSTTPTSTASTTPSSRTTTGPSRSTASPRGANSGDYELDRGADEHGGPPDERGIAPLLHAAHRRLEQEGIGDGVRRERVVRHAESDARDGRAAREAQRRHGQDRSGEARRPDRRRVGHLVRRRAGHRAGVPLPAEHAARRDRRRAELPHLPPPRRPCRRWPTSRRRSTCCRP